MDRLSLVATAVTLALLHAGCAASGPLRASPDEPLITPAHPDEPVASLAEALAPRVEAGASYVAAEREAAWLGPHLREAGIAPIELRARVVAPGDPIAVQRAATRARFGSTFVHALDAERTQALVGGALRAPPTEVARLGEGSGEGSEAFELMLLFQSPAMPRAIPESIVVELINERTGAIEPLTVAVAAPPDQD